MKTVTFISLLILSTLAYSQSNEIDDLQIFTTPFYKLEKNSPLKSTSIIDSNIQISKGVFVAVQLTKEQEFWNNGNLKFTRYYNDTKPFGSWEYYEENGQLKYSLANFKNHFVINLHFENNNIRCVRKYPLQQKATATGCVEENYFPNGSMQAFGEKEPQIILNHWELVESGKWRYFHPNGKVESIGKFKAGKKSGKWLYYNAKGIKIRSANFKDGVLISQTEY